MNHRQTLISLLNLNADATDDALAAAVAEYPYARRSQTAALYDKLAGMRLAMATRGLRTHAAEAGQHSPEEMKLQEEFMAKLRGLGAQEESLVAVLDGAYWDLLRKPLPSRWDDRPAFLRSGAPDIETLAAAQEDLLDGPFEQTTRNRFRDCLIEFASWAAGMIWRGRIPEPLRFAASQFPAGKLFRCAAFMALAHEAGVHEDRRLDLATLVVEVVR
ncbi:MAG: hypothetical protein KIT44_02770 [Opitutaceae bacterium]|nr:hypothetical protein [Opitutaceae bacterium]